MPKTSPTVLPTVDSPAVPDTLRLVSADADTVLSAIIFACATAADRRAACATAADVAPMLRNARRTIRRALTAAECGFPVPAFGRSVRTESGIIVPARLACEIIAGESTRSLGRIVSAV